MKRLIVMMLTVMSLTACHTDPSNGGGTTPPPDPVPQNALRILSAQPADSEPGVLPESLKGDINGLFGEADAEPVDIEDNDNLPDVIRRIGASI